MRRGTLFGLVLVLALVAASCGGDDEGGTLTIDGQSANDHGTKDVSGETSVEFEMDDFYFSPTVLQGTAGETITLEVVNEGENEHSLTSEGLGVDEEVESEGTATIEITFPESGQVEFHCKYHADKGMRGAVEVA